MPDFLKEKANKDKQVDKLTNLPNRVALVNDLINKKFPNSTIVILISINNLLKIQSTYGFKISDEVVKNFVKLLKSFNEKNIREELRKVRDIISRSVLGNTQKGLAIQI